MLTNDKKPVIFLAFANETESQNTGDVPRYLASLQEEKRKIQDILLQAQKEGNCELKLEAFTLLIAARSFMDRGWPVFSC